MNANTPEKNALAIRFLTHSGHTFKTIIWQTDRPDESFSKWEKLFEPSKNLDEAFIAGLMHKTEMLGPLLFDAFRRGTTGAFFDHHFNEAKNSPKRAFVNTVREIAEAIFEDYRLNNRFEKADAELTEALKEKVEAKKIKKIEADKVAIQKEIGQRLYAFLRLVQFQNAPDHD